MATTLKCPRCNRPMYLTCGNAVFSYWKCSKCQKAFEFNVWTEEFTDEENILI